MKRAWTRMHGTGEVRGLVMQHGPKEYNAVAVTREGRRGTYHHMDTLSAAQANADAQAEMLWPHSCESSSCSAWAEAND
jgi:hypothetical protein